MTLRRRQALAVTLWGVALMGLAVIGGASLGVRINLTPSLPVGLYVRDAAGVLVEFCPEGAASEESAIRGYREWGVCRDGYAPLLKPIVARAGDTVDVSGDQIAVNGTPLPNTQSHPRDHRGRALRAVPPGRYPVVTGMIWVVSSWNDGSYDSRYFGPIRESMVRQRLRPLWVVR